MPQAGCNGMSGVTPGSALGDDECCATGDRRRCFVNAPPTRGGATRNPRIGETTGYARACTGEQMMPRMGNACAHLNFLHEPPFKVPAPPRRPCLGCSSRSRVDACRSQRTVSDQLRGELQTGILVLRPRIQFDPLNIAQRASECNRKMLRDAKYCSAKAGFGGTASVLGKNGELQEA